MRAFLSSLLLAAAFGLHAQPVERCGTNELLMRMLHENPTLRETLEETDSLVKVYALHGNSQRDDEVFEIPVVVHVLYFTDAENISDAQITSQIAALNADFNMENADQGNTPSAFKNVAANPRIRFFLADRDPDGNWTKGITRRKVTVEDIGTTERYYKTSQGGADPWIRAHYLNIWVCSPGDSLLGFSTVPGMKLAEKDGIVMSPRAFGTEGTATSPYNKGRSLTHEVGHYLGLNHLWDNDDDCRTDDGMHDTPVQKGPNYGCPSFPHISCGNQPNGDMFMNFMDYTNDTCMNMFTSQQVALMRAVMKTVRKTLQHSSGYTGISPVAKDNYALYPNPASTAFFIDGLKEEPRFVRVHDLSGRACHLPFKFFNGRLEIEVEGVRNGSYLLQLNTGGTVSTHRFTVVHP